MSAFSLRISDGVRDVSLTSGQGDIGIVRYVPLPGVGGDEPINEPCIFLIEGQANARTVARDLNRLFKAAQEFDVFPAGNPVFVYWRGEGDAYERRSPVYDGSVTWGIETLDTMWAGDMFEVQCEWLRAPWWERGDAEQEAPLSNNNGTDITGGLQIFNHDDFTGGGVEEGAWLGPLGLTASEEEIEDTEGHDCWVQLNDDAVEGDLPAPARIEIKNTYATNTINTAYIGLYVDGTAQHLTLEGENAINDEDPLPETPDTSLYSGGQYRESTITNFDTESSLMTWILDSTLLTEVQGRAFRVMIRLADFFDGVARLCWQLQLNSTSVLWKSDKVRIDGTSELYDLGVITLPPLRHSENPASIAGLELNLRGQSIGGDGGTLKVDYIFLLPVASHRRIEAITGAVAQNEYLVEDGPRRAVYEINTSGQEVANYVGFGAPILLRPGVIQTLYFLMRSTSGTAPPLRTSEIVVKYRPRWSAI